MMESNLTEKRNQNAGRDMVELTEDLGPITRELEDIRERSRGSMRFRHSVAKRLGASYVLVAVAEESGIRKDLCHSFGKKGDWILSGAISMILTPDSNTTAHPDLVTNMARELLGITDSFESSMAPEFLPIIGSNHKAIEELLSRRISTTDNILVTDTPFIGEFEETVEDEDIRSMWISTDEHGIPVHYINGTIGSLRTLGFDGYQRNIVNLGAHERTFILEKRTGNADLYQRLIERGSRFISVPKSRTPCISDISKRAIDKSSTFKHNGALYSVYSTNVAIVSKRIRDEPTYPDDNDCTDTLDIVTDEDPRFKESLPDHRFTMWAFSPLNGFDVDREKLERKISVIDHRLRSLDPHEAISQFHETAGSLARFFHISISNGVLELEIKRKELDMYMNQTCEILFSYGFESWEEMIDAFDSKKKFNTAMDVLEGKLKVTSEFINEDSDRGRSFTLFLATMLWCTIAHKLREADVDVDVDTAMEWLDSVMALGDGITWKVVGLTPRNRKVMSELGVKPPKSSLVTLPYDYSCRNITDE